MDTVQAGTAITRARTPAPIAHSRDQVRHAMKPSRWVLFFRTFVPYQVLRFVWINVRMLRMISRSH